jgi:hypothetical protein
MCIKNCCINCFNDDSIKAFISCGETIGDCDYCESVNIPVADVDDIGKFIMEGIERKYEDAANSVLYNSEEGGYQYETLLINEILMDEEEIFTDNVRDFDQLIEDLVSPDGTAYVRIDPYGPLSGGISEIDSWKKFCSLVKTKKRYTLFNDFNRDNNDVNDPLYFLNCLINILKNRSEHGCIQYLKQNNRIYRGRLLKMNGDFQHTDMTSPPIESTINNRFSPIGISFFYGSFDKDTCISEMRPSVGEKVCIAEFLILKELKILDLSNDLGRYTSIFSDEYVFDNEEYFKPFMNHFVKSIAKPIRISDKDFEYIPTQIITEYLRFNPELKLNGIKYKSSIKRGGINIVLFKGPNISTENTQDQKSWLLYKGCNKYKAINVKYGYKPMRTCDCL